MHDTAEISIEGTALVWGPDALAQERNEGLEALRDLSGVAKDVAVLPEHERNASSFPVHTLSKSERGVDGYRPPRPAAAKVVAEVPFDLRSSAIHKTKTGSKTTRVCVTMTTRT